MQRRPFLLLIGFLFFSWCCLAQVKIKVACVGNSITEGANIDAGKRYPDQLQQLLGDSFIVRNYGIGGRTLLRHGDYPYWNEAKYKGVLSWQPNIVVIVLGTNDSKPQNWNYKDEFIPDYEDFIQSFVHLASHPAIYVCYPIPVFKDNYNIRQSVVKGEVIPMVRKIAKSEPVHLINLYRPMKAKAALVPDGVHPNADGAAIMAKTVYEAIK